MKFREKLFRNWGSYSQEEVSEALARFKDGYSLTNVKTQLLYGKVVYFTFSTPPCVAMQDKDNIRRSDNTVPLVNITSMGEYRGVIDAGRLVSRYDSRVIVMQGFKPIHLDESDIFKLMFNADPVKLAFFEFLYPRHPWEEEMLFSVPISFEVLPK